MSKKKKKNVIFIIRMVSERATEMRNDLHLCLIDRSIVLDTLRNEELLEILDKFDL